jgi:hypothetical protein
MTGKPQEIFERLVSIEEMQASARKKVWDLRYSLIMRFVYGVKIEHVENYTMEGMNSRHVKHALEYLQLESPDEQNPRYWFRKICSRKWSPSTAAQSSIWGRATASTLVKTGYRLKDSDEHHKLPFICNDNLIANLLWEDPLGVVPADKLFTEISLTRD